MNAQFAYLDAASGLFFAQELERVKAQTYDVKYPTLRYAELIPVSTDAGAGADVISYYQYDIAGMAKIIANYSKDLPDITVTGAKFSQPVETIGDSFSYSVIDINAARFAGKPLESRKAEAARLAYEQKVDELAFMGDAKFNLRGFLTHPNVTRVAVANDGTGSSRLWVNKTSDQIVRDVNKLINDVKALTKGVESPDTVLLPIEQYSYIATTPRSSTSDTTILEFLQNQHRGVTFTDSYRCDGAGVTLAGTDVMVAYSRTPRHLTLELPMPFTVLPPQIDGLEYKTPCYGRYGGVIVYYPLSIAIGEGI